MSEKKEDPIEELDRSFDRWWDFNLPFTDKYKDVAECAYKAGAIHGIDVVKNLHDKIFIEHLKKEGGDKDGTK